MLGLRLAIVAVMCRLGWPSLVPLGTEPHTSWHAEIMMAMPSHMGTEPSMKGAQARAHGLVHRHHGGAALQKAQLGHASVSWVAFVSGRMWGCWKAGHPSVSAPTWTRQGGHHAEG